jgi:hypothetical protein
MGWRQAGRRESRALTWSASIRPAVVKDLKAAEEAVSSDVESPANVSLLYRELKFDTPLLMSL